MKDSNGSITSGLSGASESVFIKIKMEGSVNQIGHWKIMKK